MTDQLIERVGDQLRRQGLTLAVAESCTGGLLAARLTDRAGASDFFVAGMVTYSDEAKRTLLQVPAETLARHGAVSGEAARAMAEGVRRVTSAPAAVAITGIAGPGGGSAEKPVGTVWIAGAVGERSETRHLRLGGSRAEIRGASVAAALELLQALLGEDA